MSESKVILIALEGYSEALRHEVKLFNIQVSVIEAGFLITPMKRKRQRQLTDQPIIVHIHIHGS